ncbi:hypothetical protein K466DRAFT_5785 [Polyporus arcularius HHB13444]|uniref:Uncharacterized protein n=1 Tax=Polyporus arcularius HHB13444 TaxID=1314778 RepID=A0A5C3PWX8_9APHY|nr:hypothetical protein K466DRAFT_5785 [Polyporus arcularius HHB13444]
MYVRCPIGILLPCSCRTAAGKSELRDVCHGKRQRQRFASATLLGAPCRQAWLRTLDMRQGRVGGKTAKKARTEGAQTRGARVFVADRTNQDGAPKRAAGRRLAAAVCPP